MAFYQGLILLTTLGAALFARRWQFYAVVVFWLGWTVVMVFVPWLLALQLTVVAVSGFLGTKVLDWRESRAVDARPDPDLPQAVGRVFMITTKNRSLGALDFQRVLRNHGITVARTARLFQAVHGLAGCFPLLPPPPGGGAGAAAAPPPLPVASMAFSFRRMVNREAAQKYWRRKLQGLRAPRSTSRPAPGTTPARFVNL